MSGTLVLAATPLGNPGDLSPRARAALESSDIIFAEDTKRAALACSRWGVAARRFVSCHDHNERVKLEELLGFLRDGCTCTLISDAGMPVLADPGYVLVAACRKENIPVTVIPGPCAPVTALAGSGIPPQPFVFFGFLPRGYSDVEKTIAPFASAPCTLVFFERKDRIAETLKTLRPLLGSRQVCLARELTKTHEEYIFFNTDEIPPLDDLLGELTVIVGPPDSTRRTEREEVEKIIAEEMPGGGKPREVARRVAARVCGWTSSDIYALVPGRGNRP